MVSKNKKILIIEDDPCTKTHDQFLFKYLSLIRAKSPYGSGSLKTN